MRCFYVLKKWSSAKLSLNRDLSLNKMSLNRDCTVFSILLADLVDLAVMKMFEILKEYSKFNFNINIFMIKTKDKVQDKPCIFVWLDNSDLDLVIL